MTSSGGGFTGSGASIEILNCAKTFAGGTRALKPTSLAVARGETVVLLGPSGCGKTTMLRIIAGLETSDAGGAVLFDGEDVTRVEIEKRNVGMVFQSYALFPNMTVAENIGYGLKLRKMPDADRARRIGEMLALTGIEALADRRVDQLSGGQRQRVALARAVAIRPRVLLLDEPLTALDAALRERLRTELDGLLRSLGVTTVYVTHDQAEAMALGDRVVVMRQGEIAQVGAPRDIYFRPASRFVAEFIGAANVLTGPVADNRLALAGGSVPCLAADGEVTVMIRPESIRPASADGEAWRGRVVSASFLGDRQRITVGDAASQPIVIEAPNALALRTGETIGLAVSPADVVLIPTER
jgi:putative spermidine/putrescine transport system ATP-binding protein